MRLPVSLFQRSSQPHPSARESSCPVTFERDLSLTVLWLLTSTASSSVQAAHSSQRASWFWPNLAGWDLHLILCCGAGRSSFVDWWICRGRLASCVCECPLLNTLRYCYCVRAWRSLFCKGQAHDYRGFSTSHRYRSFWPRGRRGSLWSALVQRLKVA